LDRRSNGTEETIAAAGFFAVVYNENPSIGRFVLQRSFLMTVVDVPRRPNKKQDQTKNAADGRAERYIAID